MHGLYKFVLKKGNEIIYIGKSNTNVRSRIAAHIKGKGIDEKFLEYSRDDYDIYYCELPNKVETDIMERALINQYKPALNVIDNLPGFSNSIQVNEPAWKPYNEDAYKIDIDIRELIRETMAESMFEYVSSPHKRINTSMDEYIFKRVHDKLLQLGYIVKIELNQNDDGTRTRTIKLFPG